MGNCSPGDATVIRTTAVGIIALLAISFAIMSVYSARNNLGVPGLFGGSKALARGEGIQTRGWFKGFKFKNLEVSEEFSQKILEIANSDPDVQNLLNEGYEVKEVIPTIKAIVQGSGEVKLMSTGAFVTMTKNSSWAVLQVDLTAGKVTKITIFSRTVIEKSP